MRIVSYLKQGLAQITDQLAAASTEAQTRLVANVNKQSVSLRSIIRDHLEEVFFWLIIVITTIVIVLLVSITRVFEKWLDPLLFRIKRFAPYIMQIIFGIGLVLSAYYNSFLGPALPLASVFGSYVNIVQWMLYAGGSMLVLGIYPRLISFAVLLVGLPLALQHTNHLLQHAVYIGEAGTIFFFGGAYHAFSASTKNLTGITKQIRLHLHKYKFAILRVFLGISILASAIFSQQLSPNNLPSGVVQSSLVAYFPDLSFFLFTIVTIEIILSLFIIIGFEIRFASLTYIAFLVFSVIFFQQVAWPHLILIGTPLAMLTHGYDKYTLGARLFSRGNLEPIL